MLRLAAVAGLVIVTAASAAGDHPSVVAKVRTGLKPCAAIQAYGSVWVANFGSATLARVDPKTNRVTGRVKIGGQACGLAAGAGSIWVDGYGTNTIERVNPTTLKRTRRIPVGIQPYDVAFGFGSV